MYIPSRTSTGQSSIDFTSWYRVTLNTNSDNLVVSSFYRSVNLISTLSRSLFVYDFIALVIQFNPFCISFKSYWSWDRGILVHDSRSSKLALKIITINVHNGSTISILRFFSAYIIKYIRTFYWLSTDCTSTVFSNDSNLNPKASILYQYINYFTCFICTGIQEIT